MVLEYEQGTLKNALANLIQSCKSIGHVNQIYSQVTVSTFLSQKDRSFLIFRLLFYLCTVSKWHSSLAYANKIFNHIPNPSFSMFNAMIRANATKVSDPVSCGCLILYKVMLVSGFTPDWITIPFVLKECWRRLDLTAGRSIHDHVLKFGYQNDVYVGNGLINLYSVCGVLEDARKVFDEMPKRDIVSWNSLIIGCLRLGELDLALKLFMAMDERKTIVTWNSLITGLVQGGRAKEALEFFHQMQTTKDDDDPNIVIPDKVTIASAISACASLGAIDQGRWVHSYLERKGMECDLVIATALIDMYAKCGYVKRAFEIFDTIQNKDVFAWTAMISAFALHGFGTKAFELFQAMQRSGVKPNAVTYVNLLSACAHNGLVDQGCWYFKTMTNVHRVEPLLQHYACMIDIFGRAGLFSEAEELIRSMPMKPDTFVLGSLLGACQQHRNFELGVKVSRDLIRLEPRNHAFYINLCDLYLKSGRFDDHKRIRSLMKVHDIKKTVPGSSMIEIDGVVYEFSVNRSPEELTKKLQSVLILLSNELKIDKETSFMT